MTKLYGTEKYQTAIALMNDVIAVKDTDTATSTAAWDVLFGFIHANFVTPTTSRHTDFVPNEHNSNLEYEVAKVTELFKGSLDDLLALIKLMPPEIVEVVFPVAVARYLVLGGMVTISPKSSTTFGEFNRRYTTMLVEWGNRQRLERVASQHY